jgi:gamma-glutamyltranspeptidase/glutathione hydrolase
MVRAGPSSRADRSGLGIQAIRRAALGLALLALASTISAPDADAQRQHQAAPEAASGLLAPERPAATAARHMVAAANPLAVEAGLEVLRAGGSAIDAAIATQLVLNLVEPQSSGIGGGAFIVHWHESAKRVTTIDGRETAPRGATADMFTAAGGPRTFPVAAASGRSVGVPGLVAAMELAHRRHGKLAWAELFEPAIRLAEKGFPVSPRLHGLLGEKGPQHFSRPAREHWFDADGRPRPVGFVLTAPAFAATLRRLAAEGGKAFYEGAVAEAIVAAVTSAERHPGSMTMADLAAYRAREREPVCVSYRRHTVCGMGPPSSGGITVAQVLGLIEPLSPAEPAGPETRAAGVHHFAEALKLAFADRNHWIADPDFVSVPPGLLEPGYLARRRALIEGSRAMPVPEPGNPGRRSDLTGRDATREAAGTSHISIVDGEGNAVALTSSIEQAFGSGLWAAGFLLNNQLTDFSFRAIDGEGRAVANRVEAGKRPRSSMAPTIVLDAEGRFFAALGSPGGSRIIPYVARALVALLEQRLDAQAAVSLPHVATRGATLVLERDPRTADLAAALTPLGHRIATDAMTSGLHVVVRRTGHLEGGADPRREGIAKGD